MFAFPHVVHFSWRSVPFSFPFGYSPPPRTSLPHRPSLPPLTSLPGSSLAVPVFASIPALTIFTDFFWPSHLLDYTVNSLRVGAGPTYLRVHGDSLSGAGKVLMSLFFFFSFFGFLGPHPWLMKVPRLGVESELQLPDQSCIFDLHHSSQQCQILNPLSKARD